ncbi:hypothetical protein MASR2M39_22880 [Ignavibacteriales bacterium]
MQNSHSFFIILFLLQSVGFSQNALEKGKDLFRQAETSDTVQMELYREAADLIEEYLLIDSLNAEAHYFLGYAYDRISLPSMNYLVTLDMEYLRKSISHFLKSIQISPEYKGESWHLSSYSKVISIWGTAAISYIIKENLDSARICFRQILKNGVISSTYFDYGENLLRSIPQNAIVFSDDELETFMIYYLQLMDGMRKDVTLIHAGFLSAPAYVNFIKNNYKMGIYNAAMDLSDDKIAKIQPIYRKPQKESIEIPLSVIDKYKIESSERFPKLEFVFPPVQTDMNDTSIYWISESEQVILDIIQKTKWLRDVCLTLTYQGRIRSLFSGYLRSEGLSYRLLPFITSSRNETINTEILEVFLSPPPDYFDETANFGMPFDFGSINTEEIVLDRSLYPLIDNYSSLYFDLADSYLMMDNKAQARRVMIYFDMNLKPGELIRNYTTIYRAALLYDRVGETADFDRLGKVAESLALSEISREPFSYNDPANPYDMLLDYYIKSAQKDKMIQLLKDLNQRYPDDRDIVDKLKALSGG